MTVEKEDWERQSRIWFTRLGIPPLLWLFAFLSLPLLFILVMSLGWDLGRSFDFDLLHGREFLKALNPPFRMVFLRSVLLSGFATLLCLVIALPVCVLLWRLGPQRSRRWLLWILAPFLINFLVRVYAWFVLLRPEGLLGRLFSGLGMEGSFISSVEGIILGLVYGYLPFMILPLWSVMEKMDKRLWDAAEDLGAGFPTILLRIILPYSMPGIIAGSTLVFVPMLGEYTIPKMLGGGLVPTLGTTIESQFFSGVSPHWSFGAALSCLMMLLVGVILFSFRKILRRTLDDAEVRP